MTAPEIQALAPLLGRWRTEGTVFAGDGETVAETFSGTDTYEPLGTAFVLHRVDVTMSREHIQTLEVIGPWDPFGEEFATHVFDGAGSIETSGATAQPDGSLVFNSGDGPSRAEATLRVEPGGRHANGEWRRTEDDGATWRPWMRLTLTRAPDDVPTAP